MKRFGFILGAILLGSNGSAAQAGEQPICADRPSRSTGECTVPVGRWQVETGLIDWTHDHSDGESTRTALYGSTLLKTGIGSRADIELGVTPFETLHVTDGSVHEHHSSFGDLVARLKYRLTADNAPFQLALDPFVKIPTANHHLGNGKLESGMLIATTWTLGKSGLALSFDPELDWVADEDGEGHHAATQQVANLGLSVNERFSLSAEIWAQWDWDPAGTEKRVSADGSIAYLLSNDVQLDAGANFGLNRRTPDVELYTGISARF